MRLFFLGLLIAFGLVGLTARAEACACCDAVTTLRPLGWTAAGGALLLRYESNLACEEVDQLMVWHVGAESPAGCYDLRIEPDKRIPCQPVSEALPGAATGSSKVASHFSRPPTELPRGDVRVQRARRRSAVGADQSWSVELRVAGTWHRVWRGSLPYDTAGRPVASVWPNPRGDRAMLLLGYTTSGNGNSQVENAWIELPSSDPSALVAPHQE